MRISISRPNVGALAVALTITLITAGSVPLAAQNAATLTGTVLDASGKSIPDATISARIQASGSASTAQTDREGHFRLINLAGGTYNLEISARGFATASRKGVSLSNGLTQDLPITLNIGDISQSVTVDAVVSLAAEAAPSHSSLDAVSAESIISQTYIQNFMAPTGDYSDVIIMSPGTFSVSTNGPGLGDTKTFFRGFKDGFYNMTFDGIPFNDTNDPTHHSWVWFPNQFLGNTDFNRSPGDATAIGPSNSGGSINLLSRDESDSQNIRATISYGSFNTRMMSLDYESGPFGGKAKKSNLILNVHNLDSDGYQTYNHQNRWGGSAKYQFKFSDKTVLTAFTGIIDLATNTPNVKGPTRAAVAQFGDNYLLNNNPADPLYYNYSFYQIPTDFEYVGLKTELGRGWKLEDKVYTNRYYNHQQYNGATITATSGTDKLNSYRKFGNILQVSQESKWGVFRTGVWYEAAYTDRFQIPTDPRTWVDAAVPNFHEKFITQSFQPFGQYEFRATRRLTLIGGLKMSNYNQHLNQFADNGKTIGNLGGLAFVGHTANYRAWQPNASARYLLTNKWSAYFQYATGNVIPPSSVFDVKSANVKIIPAPTSTTAYQFGSVLHFNRFTLDADAYFIRAQNPYASAPDPITGEPVYYLAGDTQTKGFEVESTIVAGRGINFYLNATTGSAKYADTHLWVQNSPKDTETIGVTYLHRNWDLGFFSKRVGELYNDNGAFNQAISIDPFHITNMYFNYTVKGESRLRGTKFRVAINNLTDSHAITGVSAAVAGKTGAPYVLSQNDSLTMLAGRSVSVSMTFGYAPKH